MAISQELLDDGDVASGVAQTPVKRAQKYFAHCDDEERLMV
jgi:hypothetical protein